MQKEDPVPRKFREIIWRRPLSTAEQAELDQWLSAHPDARREWEREAVLTQGLSNLPDVPVPSNFTARVLDAVDTEVSANEVTAPRWWIWLQRLGRAPRLAAAAAIVVGVFFVHHAVQNNQREVLAQSAAEVAELAAVAPGVDLLQDFDFIRSLQPAPSADVELLELLQ